MRLGPEDLRAALASHPRVELPALPGRTNHHRCGVLVPLAWDPDPVCWLTLRPQELSSHGGEVCFPGGRPDAADAGLEATARREAHEELGLSVVEMLGRLSSMPLYTSDYRLEPYVARVDPARLEPSPAEVERVLPVGLLELLQADHIDAIPYEWGGRRLLSPVFVLDGHPMYGGTAHVFLELLQVAAGVLGVSVPTLRAGRFGWPELLGE